MAKRKSIRTAVAYLLVGLFAILLLTACSSKAERAEEKIELGQKYLTELNYTEAVASFTEAIGLDPENIPAYMGRAEAYVGLKQYNDAKADYTTVIEKAAEQPYTQAEAYVGRGEVNELTSDNEDALSDYEAASAALDKIDVEKITDVTEQMLEALKNKVREACERLRELFSQNEAEEAEEASVVSYSYSTNGERRVWDGDRAVLADSQMTVSYQIGGNLITFTENNVVYDEGNLAFTADFTTTFTLSQPLKAAKQLKLENPYVSSDYERNGVEFIVPAGTVVTCHWFNGDGTSEALRENDEWDEMYIYEGDELLTDIPVTSVTIPAGKSYDIYDDERERSVNVTFTAD